ncbi:outer membrane protein assembly factor BamA [Conchiformibius kuhniae]
MNLKKLTLTLIALGLVSPALASGFNISELRIEGEQHTSEATVHSLLPVKAGEAYTPQTGEDIIRSLYASGFYENVTLEQNGNMLIITVKERPIISNITIKGAKVLQADAILKQMAQMRGSTNADAADLISDPNNLDHDTKLQSLERDAGRDAEQALAATGLSKGDFFSQEALTRALQALAAAYREQGKNNVKITPQVQELARNRVAVTINIEEGDTTRVKQIEFEGNQHFSDARLARQIGLTDGTLMSWATKSDVFAWEKFAADKARLESFYRTRGFFDAEVDLADRELNDERTREKVVIKVSEGKRYRWGKTAIGGDNKEVPQEKLLKHLAKIQTGKWSNFEQLEQVLAAIRLELQSAGYAYADAQVEAQRHSDDNGEGIIDITVQLIPGPRIAVREINISGNKKTRDEVIRREFRQMEGAVYDKSKLDRSQQRLMQLGYFEDVKIEGKPTAENDQQLDVSVAVKERNTGSLNASAGWSQDDGLVIAASVAQDNLFGTGKSASAGLSRSKVRQNANISFTDPYFTPDGVSMTYSLFGSNYNPYKLNQSPRSYRIKKYGGTAIMGVPVTEYDRVNFGLGAEHLTVGLYPQSPTRYRRFVDNNGSKNWIYKGLLSWYRNTTDDAFWPTKGYQANVSAEAGLPGSGLQYYQLDHQQTWYVPLNKTFTLMLNGQFGYSGNYGKTKELPFMYAQTGGGLGSVRGYETGSLGPKFYDYDCDTATNKCYNLGTEHYGGKLAANVNAELLFPFPGMKNNKSVRLSLFADAGSVWDGKTYTPGLYHPQTNPNAHNNYYGENVSHKSSFQKELRYSAGAALTWISPMGPIKLSYAYPLNKKKTDQVQRFQFQLGTVF